MHSLRPELFKSLPFLALAWFALSSHAAPVGGKDKGREIRVGMTARRRCSPGPAPDG